MNNGKVCVSVSADSAADLLSLLHKAEPLTGVVELRLDGLSTTDVELVLNKLQINKQLLITMRPKDEGGRSELSLEDRISFWTASTSKLADSHKKVWIDLEHDLIPFSESIPGLNEHLVVRSRHFFGAEVPAVEDAYNGVVSEREVVKIAVTAEDVTDGIGVWQLLSRANEESRKFVPIAMGEAGKWTRILSPAYGAYMTYAVLGAGHETASGQVSAHDLIETFRVRELDRDTKVFGLIAGNTSYSISPWMHNAAFKAAGLNAVFVPLQTINVENFLRRMVRTGSREVNLNFAGFSVTNPHKETIIPLLDEVDETAARIGAVNTVKINEAGRLTGFNTDAQGFISTLKESFRSELSGVRVAVLGAGGAARACVYMLRNEGAEVTVIARNEAKKRGLAEEFDAVFKPDLSGQAIGRQFDIVVNTTPVGTAGPEVNLSPLADHDLTGVKLVYDLVYNPNETRLLHDAMAAGVPAVSGMDMLIAQGARQFEIWTGLEAPADVMRAAVKKRLGA